MENHSLKGQKAGGDRDQLASERDHSSCSGQKAQVADFETGDEHRALGGECTCSCRA